MAAAQLSAASLPAHAVPTPCPHPPMANPGYGKRTAPGQRPRTAHDFAHLPPREAAIAAFIDRLPDGADISVKTLAKTLPYGQCALRTALNRLQEAGHLRRGRECVTTDLGSSRWITCFLRGGPGVHAGEESHPDVATRSVAASGSGHGAPVGLSASPR